MKQICAVIKPFKLDEVREALSEIAPFTADWHNRPYNSAFGAMI